MTPAERYWRSNRLLIVALLLVWGLVSLGFAILLARPLNSLAVGTLPMGFWWAHQGAMLVFVALIFVYAWVMDRLDERYDVHEERPPARQGVRGRARTAPTKSGEPPGEGR